MIKAILATKGGGKLLLIGLSRANCEEMMKGRPIHFSNKALPLIGITDVVVMAGENEGAIAKELQNALQLASDPDAKA